MTPGDFAIGRGQAAALSGACMLAAAMLGAAAAQPPRSDIAAADMKTVCQGEVDARSVKIDKPGLIGAVCDVSYVRDQGLYESIPFHANADADACVAEATKIITTLMNDGFRCVGPLVAEAEALANAAPTAVAALDEPSFRAPPVDGLTAKTTRPSSATAGPVNLTAALTPVSLDGPAPRRARYSRLSGAPVRLAAIAQPTSDQPTSDQAQSEQAAAATPERAEPEEPAQPARVDEAAKTGPLPQAPRETASAPDAPRRDATPQSEVGPGVEALAGGGEATARLRPAADIIEGVLMAQSAAWNEGDLEAFMDGYWRSDDLRFVSGGRTRKGWNAALKHYRKTYGDAPETMGQLDFDDISIQFIADDVAVVVGRYEVKQGGNAGEGSFSLVMKQIGGLWRIVHDHTTADHE